MDADDLIRLTRQVWFREGWRTSQRQMLALLTAAGAFDCAAGQLIQQFQIAGPPERICLCADVQGNPIEVSE